MIGAGIGGLAAAIALARRGADVEVLEGADALREAGAGLQISPNGVAVLRGLGLARAVARRGRRAEAVELRRGEDARLVVRLDVSGRDWLMVHRRALLGVLAEAARDAGVRITTGAEAVAIEEDDTGATVRLARGEDRSAWLAIGADGLGGRTRRALGEDRDPAFTGQTAWRALVEGDGPAVAEVHMGRGRHLVTYPLGSGLRNVVGVVEERAWGEEGWALRGDPADFRAAFAGLSPPVRALLDRVDVANRWGLFRHPVVRRWHGRRIALLGDAAHPTLPFLAQGANLALEDAWALADCLAHLPLDRALPAYQDRRRARAARAIAAANRNAWVYHLRPGLRRAALHAGLRIGERLVPGASLRRYAWLHDHDETAVAPATRAERSGAFERRHDG